MNVSLLKASLPMRLYTRCNGSPKTKKPARPAGNRHKKEVSLNS